MNHWYHWLRNQKRYYDEYNFGNFHFDDVSETAQISKYYYGNLGGLGNRDTSEENCRKKWE